MRWHHRLDIPPLTVDGLWCWSIECLHLAQGGVLAQVSTALCNLWRDVDSICMGVACGLLLVTLSGGVLQG